MSEQEQFEVLEPQYGFWEATIVINTEDSESGKPKKTKEVHLVDAISVSDVESKIAKEMDGTLWEWKIESIKQSKLNCVY